MKIMQTIADLASKVLRTFPIKKTVHLKPTNKSEPIGRQTLANFLNASPTSGGRQSTRNGRRMVLVDGTNVASTNSAGFRVDSLEACLDKLSAQNETYAFVPQFRLKNAFSSNNRRLQQLERELRVYITPGKTLNGEIRTCNPNPFLLDVAKEFGAAIVSNDGFVEERRLDGDFDRMLRDRQVGFKWTSTGIEFAPADSNAGQTLEDILR